jgi:PAS domain S-box-containing protein
MKETRLSPNQERARLLAIARDDVEWDWDLATNVVWWSGGLKASFGYEAEGDARNSGWWRSCIHIDDRERVSRSIDAVIAGSGSAWSDEYRFGRRDGTYATVLDRGVVVRRDGVAVRLVGSMIDITARATSEQALRELEERHRQILDAIADCVLVKGPHSKIVWANRAFRELYGMSNEQLQGLIDAPFSEPDHTQQYIVDDNTVFTTGLPLDIPEEKVTTHNGELRHVHTVKSPIFDSTGKVIMTVGVFRDISERKHMAEQLLLADRMVSLGTLAAGVAHEINNPLAFVLSNLDLLNEELGRQESLGPASPLAKLADLAELARDARDGADRVRTIVRGLKTFSRADQERRVPVQLAQVIDLSINMTRNELRHRARIVKDYGPVPLVEADETRLAQVFINLLVNAAHALPEGNADTNQIRLRTSTRADGCAIVEVSDTGPGIAPDILRRVFEPFFTTKAVGEGTGLGLSICHGVISALGGEITVSSELGKGTTFRVVLPPAPVLKPIEIASVPAPVVRAKGRRANILIVDDDPMVGKSLSRVLARDHDVQVLSEGQAALELIRSGARFDIIFCDLMMPVLTGMALCLELKNIAPDQLDRVVLMTGGAFTIAARQFLDAVPNERMDKPFDNQNVRALVRRLILIAESSRPPSA